MKLDNLLTPPHLKEGYKVMPPMDKNKYPEMPGLEGPFTMLSGKVVYYDPKEGAYYDKDTDMYMSYDEFQQHDNDYSDMKDERDEISVESLDQPGAEPQATVNAYKLFNKKKDGGLYPLYVNPNKRVQMGVWVPAEEGERAEDSKTGKRRVKSKLGNLAFRPGWHAGDYPIAKHIGGKSKGKSMVAPDYRPDNQVWALCYLSADIDWQEKADANATVIKSGPNKGEVDPQSKAITTGIPIGGHYRFKTNTNMEGNWIIGGELKVVRELSDDEVKAINAKGGYSDLPRLHEIQAMGENLQEDAAEEQAVYNIFKKAATDLKRIDPSVFIRSRDVAKASMMAKSGDISSAAQYMVKGVDGPESQIQDVFADISDSLNAIYYPPTQANIDAEYWDDVTRDKNRSRSEPVEEGKSPHKKGTKKYNAHMAAMHAEGKEKFDHPKLKYISKGFMGRKEAERHNDHLVGKKKASGKSYVLKHKDNKFYVVDIKESVEEGKEKFEPHMMYDPKTGEGKHAKAEKDHLDMKAKGWGHDKPKKVAESKVSDNTKRMVSMKQIKEAVKQKNPTTAVAHYVKSTLNPEYTSWDQVHEQVRHIISCIKEGETVDSNNVMDILVRFSLQEQVDRSYLIKENIDSLRTIVRDKAYQTVKFSDGSMKVDLTTASMFIQVYEKQKPETQAKMDKMLEKKSGFLKLLDVMYSKMS